MNSYERVMNRFAGKPVDRLPNFSLVMMFAAKQLGVTFGNYCTDYRLLADGAWLCYEKFGFDHLCAISDPMREAEGFGAQLVIPDNGIPFSPVKRIQKLSDIDTLKVIDPASGRRMNDRLEAVRVMKERACGEVPVVGWIEGALAESCDLMDMQEVFINLLDESDPIEQMMDICAEQAILFAKAQVEAGADIIAMGDAAASLIGHSLYEEFLLERQQKIIKAIHDMGAKVKLHICGNINPVMDLIAQTGADMVDGTPILDVKPYLPYTDSHPDAIGGFADPVRDYSLDVVFPEEWMEQVPHRLREPVLGLLAQDPRPSYQNDPERVYGFSFGGYEISFRVEEKILTVDKTEKIQKQD